MWVRKVGRAHLGNSHLVAVSCWQEWQWAARAGKNGLLTGLVGEAGVQVGYQLQCLTTTQCSSLGWSYFLHGGWRSPE